jgi:hypothetical protein
MNFKIGMTIYILIWLSLLLLFVHSISPPKTVGIPQIGCGQRKSVSQNKFEKIISRIIFGQIIFGLSMKLRNCCGEF